MIHCDAVPDHSLRKLESENGLKCTSYKPHSDTASIWYFPDASFLSLFLFPYPPQKMLTVFLYTNPANNVILLLLHRNS